MMHFLWTSVHYLGAAAVCACLIVVAIKVLWNLGLPYAMMREKQRSWSIFPLIEIVPVFVGILISYLTRQEGVLSPGQLAVWGFGAVFTSYLHLAIVAILYGVAKRIRERNHNAQ